MYHIKNIKIFLRSLTSFIKFINFMFKISNKIVLPKNNFMKNLDYRKEYKSSLK